MAKNRKRMGAWKKSLLKTFITAALLGAMSLPVCAYMDAGSAAHVYMEETGDSGTVDSPESSVTVWLSPWEGSTAQSAQPAEDDSSRESSGSESPFSIPGNGEVLDEIRSSSDKDFYAIQTQNHNTFYLVIDHASSSDNVYMLSMIDEDDLEEFLKEKKEPEPEPEPVIIEEPVAEPEEPAEPEPKKKGGGLGWLIFIVLASACVIGGYYYFRFYRPAQEEDDVESENMEYSDTRFPTENEDDVEES